MSDVSLSPEAQAILNDTSSYTKSDEFLNEMCRQDTLRVNHYTTFEQYYTGENQRVRLTDRVRRFLQMSGFLWCENFCEVVVDALAERLIIESLDTGDDDDDIDESDTGDTDASIDTLNDWVKHTWSMNRFDELQSIVHTNTPMKGDGFVIVDIDSDTLEPRMHFNRPEIIKPIYDSEHPDLILMASKFWVSKLETPTNPNCQPIRRMNLYYSDRVEKWFNAAADGSGEWEKHLDPSDIRWPIPWTDTGELDGEPLGVPVFHFRNKSHGRTWGLSEIRGTIPQQDGLNKQILDLVMVLDQNGFPQRWATGIKREDAQTMSGNAGTVWTNSNADAKYGQFDPANPDGLLKAIDASLQRLAGRSRTPLFLLVLSGDAPSGESLKTAESGLVAKCRDRSGPLGSKWCDVWVMSARIAQANGALKGIDIVPDLFTCVWRDFESRNMLEQRQALAVDVGQLGLSKHTALTELGYDADEEQDLKDEEQTKAVQNFNAGIPTVPVTGDTSSNSDSAQQAGKGDNQAD